MHCIEPRNCPHTKGPRDWSFPETLRTFVREANERTPPLIGPVIFHCIHRVYGVGMFDTSVVIEGDRTVAGGAAGGDADVVVGTVSHCHAALNILSIRDGTQSAITGSRVPEPAAVGP